MRFVFPVGSIFVGFLFLILFLLDLRGFFSANSPTIAEVKYLQGEARRQGSKELTWNRAFRGTPLASHDVFMTGQNSFARLVFSEGLSLDLSASTMVQVELQKEELALRFLSGKVKVWKSKNLIQKIKIESPAPAEVLEPVEVEEQISEAWNPPKDTSENSIEDPSNQPTNQPKGLEHSLAALPPPPEIKPVSVVKVVGREELKNPLVILDSQEEIFKFENPPVVPGALVAKVNPSGEVELRWDPVKEGKGYWVSWKKILEEPRRDMSEGSVSGNQGNQKVQEAFFRIKNLQPGKYDWSVRSKNEKGVFSEAAHGRLFELAAMEVPQPKPVTSPKKTSEISGKQVKPMAVEVE